MFESDAHDHQAAYELWQVHNDSPQKNTELTTLHLLRTPSALRDLPSESQVPPSLPRLPSIN